MDSVDPDRPRRGASHPAGERRSPARRKPPSSRQKAPDAGSAMAAATEQLAKLLGRIPESVSSLKPTDDGWEAQVEVLELERIPDTTSVLASYKVSLDGDGTLISFERTRRYNRGMIDRPF
ncbi:MULTISPECIES: gas vesicle protein [unclassified Streptomyces]|uniref:gas vesicle protein GvpO n=1 Tax=unclassified Streptomyces TaxID=2593676 RepID=UPI001E375A35|nr:gas vesicle protein [Streptomyces sp. CB02980]MCB8906986.1 gas vesicle protein [Streptomyces sp. CB02980]